MDTLSPYNQGPGGMPPGKAFVPSPEGTFFVRLVMRLSGGMIRNAEQATKVLLGLIIIVFAVSAFLFFLAFRDTRPVPSAEDMRVTPSSEITP